jgi:hypothetical protein
MEILPKVPSELIRVALADLKKVEAHPSITVDMDDWIASNYDGLPTNARPHEYRICSACLAGSVMIFSLAGGPDNIPARIVSPMHFPGNENQLFALDSIRGGYIADMFGFLGLNPAGGYNYEGIVSTPYEENPEKFKEELEKLAKILEKDGF